MQNVDPFRYKLPVRINGNNALFFPGIDNGLRRNEQHFLTLGIQLQVGIHARFQQFILVGDLQAHLQRTGGLIHARQKTPFFNREEFIRISRYRNSKLRGIFEQISNGFRDRRADPDRIHPLNLRHHLFFGNIHPGAQVKGRDHPVNGRLDGKPGLDSTGCTQPLNIVIRHTRQAQTLQNAFYLRGRSAGTGEQEELALRFDPVRNGDINQRRAFYHLIANRQRVHFLNEPFRTRLHNDKLIFVIADVGRDRLGIIQLSARHFLRF